MSEEAPLGIGIAIGPNNTENIEWQMASKHIFVFGKPTLFLMLSLNVIFLYLESFNV